ncbi:MAG: diguanylate cyclase domain-containing protein [Burkholderiaceae bacterium]
MTNSTDSTTLAIAELRMLHQVFAQDTISEGLNALATGLSMFFGAHVEWAASEAMDQANDITSATQIEWVEIGGQMFGCRFVREEPLSAAQQRHARLIIDLATRWFNSLATIDHITRQLDKSAYIDPLTGLANHRYFKEALTRSIARSSRSNLMLAVLHIDLIGFKKINVHLGDDIGDELLFALAEQLKRLVRADDIVARIGPDEFLILLNQVGNQENVSRIVERFENCLATPPIPTHLWKGARIGIASYPLDAKDGDALMEAARLAMKSTKDSDHAVHAYFNELPVDTN